MTWWEQLAPRVVDALPVHITAECIDVASVPVRLLVRPGGCVHVAFVDGTRLTLPPMKEYADG